MSTPIVFIALLTLLADLLQRVRDPDRRQYDNPHDNQKDIAVDAEQRH
jgi:hypothetical protein